MAVAAVSPIVAQLIPGKFIPQTVLLLAAGTALGPYGLGVIEVNDAVKLLSELGMAFLFLLAGYEIDPQTARRTSRKSRTAYMGDHAGPRLAGRDIPSVLRQSKASTAWPR